MQRILILALTSLLVITNSVEAQQITEAARVNGFIVEEELSWFIFDESVYEVSPEKVVVTGAFRSWDANMQVPQWDLRKQDKMWVLSFENLDYALIRPNTPFKFRIDDGQWLDPPALASNVKGGNLIFSPQEVTKSLKAEIRNNSLIWAEVVGDRPLTPDGYQITDSRGNTIKVASVFPNEGKSTLIVPATPLDKRLTYYLKIPSNDLDTQCSFDGWFRDLVSPKELGANVKGSKTSIRLFAPRAELVRVHLYRGRNDSEAYRIDDLGIDANGVWEINYDEDLHGVYYDFTVHGSTEPGGCFFETTNKHITDPYARVSDDTWGKARIWRATEPATPLKNGIPAMEDVIAYEVHVQDFTDLLPVEEQIRGTIPAMTKSGLTNAQGRKIGFDYLLDLGVNVIHLMPVQEFVHFPTEDWKASFENDPYMIEQGISEENYQWGYRTSHAFAVESRYRTKGKEPGAERDEFRDLVQAFHDNDIAVIIDIVPNHTAENMTTEEWYFNFNGIDKQYYYRTKNLEHIGEYGNEVKTENRPMTQRWLIDQCLHFVNEFGIDGFRIDLAGQIDQQTLKALKATLGEDIIVYGEAWIGSNDPNFEENPDWDWYKEDSPITFFQDDARNAFKGPVFELNNPATDRGWAGGKYNERSNVMKGLTNTFADDKTPLSGINYLDIHDNFALADQFGENFDGRYNVDEELYKIAVTLLYTSVGPIVTHGGSEIMRSKAHAPLGEVVKKTRDGHTIYLHGYRDTYNHRTANRFQWNQVGQTPTRENMNDYANMQAFWSGLNAFRLSEYGEKFRIPEALPDGYYQWILPDDESKLGYIVDQSILVLLNPGDDAATFDLSLPDGTWQLIATMEEVDHLDGVESDNLPEQLTGGETLSLSTEGRSLYIWVRK